MARIIWLNLRFLITFGVFLIIVLILILHATKFIQVRHREKCPYVYRIDEPTRSLRLLSPNRSETIHMCVVAGMEGIETEVEVFLNIDIHFLCGDGSRPRVEKILPRKHHPFINIKYDLRNLNKQDVMRELDKIHVIINKPGDIYKFAKAFLHLLFPDIDKYPAYLWNEFKNQHDLEIITMKVNQDMPNQDYANSGVMLLNMKRMREIQFQNNYIPAAKEYCSQFIDQGREYYTCNVGDQNLFYGVFRNRSHLFSSLPPSWTLEFCYDFLGFTFDRYYSTTNNMFFGIAHLNCLNFISHRENGAFLDFVEGKGYNKILIKYIKAVMNI
ncbi:hypothetical protein ACJMK2_029903 [Sinanodonta woodiana]|uniref:Uncharacterized protein n=1 Tax=Sinanodonta woodiana TaxID=1069815 RepID=A0ABD3XFM1_SINWO